MRPAAIFRTTPLFRAIPVLLVASVSGCRGDGSAHGGAQVQHEVHGDTTIVRTLSGSEWGDSVRVDQELSIGQLDGPPEYQFATIEGLAVDSAGGIYVFDNGSRVLRYYDADGKYVRTLGREGQGPGEYGDAVLGMAVRHSDGRLLVDDARNARMNIYNPDGSFAEQWPIKSGLFTTDAMTLDTADNVYIKIIAGKIEQDKPWPIALMHMDADGQVLDTIRPPVLADEPTGSGGRFLPSKMWTWSPLSYFVAGVSKTYSFELALPNGKVTRIERSVEPVAVTPGEKSEYEAVNAWIKKYQGRFMTAELPGIPDVKAAYKRLLVGEEGRIWVPRYMPAVKGEPVQPSIPSGIPGADEYPAISWHEPNVMDVFRPDGTYLGAVRLPPHFNAMVIRGDLIWGVRRDDMDIPYVVRLRVQHGQGEPHP